MSIYFASAQMIELEWRKIWMMAGLYFALGKFYKVIQVSAPSAPSTLRPTACLLLSLTRVFSMKLWNKFN